MLFERMTVTPSETDKKFQGKKLLKDHQWSLKMVLLIEY